MHRRVDETLKNQAGRGFAIPPTRKREYLRNLRRRKDYMQRAAKRIRKKTIRQQRQQQPTTTAANAADEELDFVHEKTVERAFPKFSTIAISHTFNIRPQPIETAEAAATQTDFENQLNRIHRILQQIILVLNRDINRQDRVGLMIRHQSLHHPIHINMTLARALNIGQIVAVIGRHLNSVEHLLLEGRLEIDVIIVHMPHGEGRKKQPQKFKSLWHTEDRLKLSKQGGVSKKEFMIRKRSVITIKNDDHLCFANALLMAKARFERDTSDEKKKKFKSFKINNQSTLNKAALELIVDAGLDPENPECVQYDNWNLICDTMNIEWYAHERFRTSDEATIQDRMTVLPYYQVLVFRSGVNEKRASFISSLPSQITDNSNDDRVRSSSSLPLSDRRTFQRDCQYHGILVDEFLLSML